MPHFSFPGQRLFDAVELEQLAAPEYRAWALARLLEDGDGADLRAWFRRAAPESESESEARAVLVHWGDRLLSRRSRAFWSLLLEPTGAVGIDRSTSPFWPLA